VRQAQLDLLREELALLAAAEQSLHYSYGRCLELGLKAEYTPEEQERFESLANRFARMSDILAQKVFRLIDRLDLDDQGSVRDRMNRAEKKGLVTDADAFSELRELRNRIAHEYVPTAVQTIFREVLSAVPALLDSGERVRAYCKRYAAQGEK